MTKRMGVVVGLVLMTQTSSLALASAKYTSTAISYIKAYFGKDDVEDGLEANVKALAEKGETYKSLKAKLDDASKLSQDCENNLNSISSEYRSERENSAKSFSDSNSSKEDIKKADYGLNLDESVGDKPGFDPNAMGASGAAIFASKMARKQRCEKIQKSAGTASAQCAKFAQALEPLFPAVKGAYAKTCSRLLLAGSTKAESEKDKSDFVAIFIGKISQGPQDKCTWDSDILERVRNAEKPRIMCTEAHRLIIKKIQTAIERGTPDGVVANASGKAKAGEDPAIPANKPKDHKKAIYVEGTQQQDKADEVRGAYGAK